MDLKRITERAKGLVEKRGGTDSLKEDADELKGIAKREGSFTDKAKAAVSAIKDPGAEDTARPAPEPKESPAADATDREARRAEKKVKGEDRGKHAQGAGRGEGRGGRAEGDRGRDDDSAV
jgi:hypothetical protein